VTTGFELFDDDFIVADAEYGATRICRGHELWVVRRPQQACGPESRTWRPPLPGSWRARV